MFWLMVAEELKQMIQSAYGFNGKIYFSPVYVKVYFSGKRVMFLA